ncbi:MAG: cold shock domain-containing protein [candidate division Zixibacteria bacterium]|nr:cold shock domain-containing protein [candidate division Zixibacteria bacterium]
MPQGVITRLNPARGFGFVSNPEGNDLFFHRTNVRDTPFSKLQIGDRVTYDLQHTDRGPRAGNLQMFASAVQLQVNLAVSDLSRSVGFYVQTLGFRQVAEHPGYTLVQRGALVLGLKMDDLLWHPALKDRSASDLVRGVGTELVLEVSDIDEFHAAIQNAGLVIQEPLREQPWGARDFRLLDPDGYYWRISSPRQLTEQIAISED